MSAYDLSRWPPILCFFDFSKSLLVDRRAAMNQHSPLQVKYKKELIDTSFEIDLGQFP